ncbi:tetratricopeptide repeat protein [Mesoterricola silvestris]|uniref:Tetratricopeptide repeat protein n=1 Tax=Mesoterricola silvestris TaxID=2927979 RepID=A0AA48KC69_9BACT|nr:tetratricopeptide repeat protein [Mesoterricola silvestris]BDU73193.1 hypothetical protein METEAL_23670 [Mesoterricola silvestris]
MLSIALAALVVAAPPAPEAPRSMASFCEEAVRKFGSGDLNGGLGLLDAAQKAHPRDSKPHWLRAQVLLAIAAKSGPVAAGWYRCRAEDELESVYLAPGGSNDDRSTLQVLLDDLHGRDYPDVGSRHPKAREAFKEAETFFGAKDYAKARTAYARALAQDPGFVLAMLYMGDTYHGDIGDPEALAWYRRAAQAQPNYPRAWRYLSDACIAAGQRREAEEALMARVASHPGNRLLWLKLADLRAQGGRPMRKLDFVPPFVPGWDKDGKLSLKATNHFLDFAGKEIWPVLLAGSLGAVKVEAKSAGQEAPPVGTPFQREIFFWTAALQALDAEARRTGEPPRDRILGEFLRFRKDGQLEAALFLLRYQEAFRPEFEAWKKAHPGAVQAFIRDYGYRP